MTKEKIIVIGTGWHAKVVIDIINEMKTFKIKGVISQESPKTNSFFGIPIIGDDSILPELLENKKIKNVAIGVGGWDNYNENRKKIYNKLKKIGFKLPNIIYPSAIMSKTIIIGEGNVIFPGVVINTGVKLCNNIVIATGSSIDHDTIINNHVLISAGVTIGGNNIIGENSLISLGSKIISDLKIGKNINIGAGAVVVKDCFKSGTYLGIPARLVI